MKKAHRPGVHHNHGKGKASTVGRTVRKGVAKKHRTGKGGGGLIGQKI